MPAWGARASRRATAVAALVPQKLSGRFPVADCKWVAAFLAGFTGVTVFLPPRVVVSRSVSLRGVTKGRHCLVFGSFCWDVAALLARHLRCPVLYVLMCARDRETLTNVLGWRHEQASRLPWHFLDSFSGACVQCRPPIGVRESRRAGQPPGKMCSSDTALCFPHVR